MVWLSSLFIVDDANISTLLMMAEKNITFLVISNTSNELAIRMEGIILFILNFYTGLTHLNTENYTK